MARCWPPAVNDNGNVLNITNNRDSNRTVAYAYDALNRIASATTANTDCSLVSGTSLTKNWGQSFTIDAWGNLTGKTVTKCSAESLSVGPATALNQFPVSNGFGYDAAGNMTSNGGASYTYNAESQLATAGGVTYTYDGDGNRVKKSNGTLYWGSGPTLESDLSGNLQREFVFAGGGRIARRDISGGAFHFYFTDHLGSTDVVTNSTGTLENDSAYYPYGGERAYTASLATQNYKFSGKERDVESGLDEFGARYYGNALGRFMIPDWSEKATAVPYANFGNPQSLNLYSFVQNNPTTLGDPDGHDLGGLLEDIVIDKIVEHPEAAEALATTGEAIEGATIKTGTALGEGASKLLTAASGIVSVAAIVLLNPIPAGGPGDTLTAKDLEEVPAPEASASGAGARKGGGPKPGSTDGPGSGKRATPAQRSATLKENGGKCVFCGGPAKEADHAIAKSRGGDTTTKNLQPTCTHCNRQKGAKSPAEYLKWKTENQKTKKKDKDNTQ